MARKRPEAPVAQRHVHYSPEIAQRLCEEMASGRSLTEVCEQPDMPDRRSVRRWIVDNPEFRDQYEAARLWWAHSVAEEINDLADKALQIAADAEEAGRNGNAAVAALRTRLENKRWLLSKILPQQYGDKISQEITGPGGAPLLPEPDIGKTALGLLTAVHSILRSRNPETPPSARTVLSAPAAGTLLSGAPAPAEPAPVPVKKLDQEALDPAREFIGSHPILDRSGRKTHPVFDTASGRVLRFVSSRGEQG